jgi:hypothetical protein
VYASLSLTLVSSQFESGIPEFLWEKAKTFIDFFCYHLRERFNYKQSEVVFIDTSDRKIMGCFLKIITKGLSVLIVQGLVQFQKALFYVDGVLSLTP